MEFDGKKVFLNVDPSQSKDKMSIGSRIAHEVEHGMQLERGQVGFRKGTDGWGPFWTDVFDEVDAWDAQLRAASGFDLAGGKLRDYRESDDRAKFLIRNGYSQYKDRERRRVDAPALENVPRGTLITTDSYYFRTSR